MKSFKKYVCLLMAVFIVSALSFPAMAKVKYPKTKTLYLKGGNENHVIRISGLTQKLEGETVKSSRPGTAKISWIRQVTETDHDLNNLDEKDNHYSEIHLVPGKAGTANISFRVYGRKYTTAVTVKDYVNPLKNLIVPGIRSGKNIAGGFNKKPGSSRTIPEGSDDAGYIRVQAKDGWKIRSVTLRYGSTGRIIAGYSSSGVTSCKVLLSKPVSSFGEYEYKLEITSMNARDKGFIRQRVNIEIDTGDDED